jgi:hypothetical protein
MGDRAAAGVIASRDEQVVVFVERQPVRIERPSVCRGVRTNSSAKAAAPPAVATSRPDARRVRKRRRP